MQNGCLERAWILDLFPTVSQILGLSFPKCDFDQRYLGSLNLNFLIYEMGMEPLWFTMLNHKIYYDNIFGVLNNGGYYYFTVFADLIAVIFSWGYLLFPSDIIQP